MWEKTFKGEEEIRCFRKVPVNGRALIFSYLSNNWKKSTEILANCISMGGTLQILSAFSWKKLFREFLFLFRAHWWNCRYFICGSVISHRRALCLWTVGIPEGVLVLDVFWFSVMRFKMPLKNRAILACVGQYVKGYTVAWKVKVWLKSYRAKDKAKEHIGAIKLITKYIE